MRPTNIGKSMLIVTTMACFAVNVPQAEAMGFGQRHITRTASYATN